MSLRWDVSKIKNSDAVCFERIGADRATPGMGQEWQKTGNEFVRLSPKTAALVWSSLQTGLSEVTRSNIEETLYRLDSLFDAGVAFLFAKTQEGMVPIRITRDDVMIHVGLKTSSHSWGPQEFDKHVRDLRTQRQIHTLLDPTTDL